MGMREPDDASESTPREEVSGREERGRGRRFKEQRYPHHAGEKPEAVRNGAGRRLSPR